MNLLRTSSPPRGETGGLRRRGARGEQPAGATVTRGGLLSFLLFLLFGLLALLICFAGLSPAGPMVQRDQVARIRVTAEFPFTYISQIETNRRLEAVRQKVPPVFRLDLAPYRAFRAYLEQLVEELAVFARVPEDTPPELARLRTDEVQAFLLEYPRGNPHNLRPADLAALYNQLGPARMRAAVAEGLIVLGEILGKGVYPDDAAFGAGTGPRLTLFHVEDELGNLQEVQILSEEEGLRTLRIQLSALDVPRESTVALFRVLRAGLAPNLVFDADRTRQQVEAAQRAVQPVEVQVAEGETLIEPNTRVTALQAERLEAYRRALRQAKAGQFGINQLFLEQALLTLLLVGGAAFFLRASRTGLQRKHRVLALSGTVILGNLLLLRLVLELGESVVAEAAPVLVQLLPYLTPILLGPMVIAILVGAGPGILAAGLVAAFNAMMQGNSLAVLLLSQLVCLVAISHCRNLQLRASLVRAGLIAGAVLGAGALLFALRDKPPAAVALYQLLSSLGNGLLSGMLIVGLLPVLEHLFRHTTDITLLELTDFNHPLLRKMQLEAPGSYHHSLMVANLAERAALAVGANPLVCRVCSLFHDIGKIVKPEYFAENQGSGPNPHIERNPSMSALVIKSHVKEGVQLARQYRLPQVISDVIRQHHGTSLIQYFYYKALEKQRAEGVIESVYPNAPRIELNTVNEETYRYEGPIPQFTESALIMLADCVEAASRSLRKVTPQSAGELVDKIFRARMEDGQLDATPLTFAQLTKVKESFVITLLNMLHARVEYPEGAPAENGAKARRKAEGSGAAAQPPFPAGES